MSRTHDSNDLRARLKAMGFSIYVDLRRFAQALRERLPWPKARRSAEYVLIDGKEVPIGWDTSDFERRHLRGVKVQDGVGFTPKHHTIRASHAKAMPGAPQPDAAQRIQSAPPSFVRHDRQPSRPHV